MSKSTDKAYQNKSTKGILTTPITLSLSLSESSASSGLLNSLTSYDKKSLEKIQPFNGGCNLASHGENDKDNFQIFTPAFIVRDMVEGIGGDVLDFSKTILEPTSGDGAFTTYILKIRLGTIKENFAVNILRALSTIYSVEMDEALLIKQRCNIFTIITKFLQEHNLEASEDYLKIIKIMIALNFIWGEFNTDIPQDTLFDEYNTPLVFDMSKGGRKKNSDVQFVVWQISDNKISMHYEEVEV